MFAPRTLAMGIGSSVVAGRAVYTGKVGGVSTGVRRARIVPTAQDGVGKIGIGLVVCGRGRATRRCPHDRSREMRYELYYWPTIQGRGEFVRLALEEAGADYVDVARRRGKLGVPAMMKFIDGVRIARPPFAPPFLRAGKLLIGQTANILLYLGKRLGLAPRDEAGRLWVHQLQLTITDLVVLIHDTHHPITGYLYYEEQRAAAKLATKYFWRYRLPKFLHYFERVLDKSRGPYVLGRKLCYVDLSLFQVVEGLRYAFPKRMKRFERKVPRIVALHDRVARRPRIAAYLASDRRIAFSQWGIYRYFKDLDA
jgi:glutathione S-transferase